MNQAVAALVQSWTPPAIWNAYLRLRGRRHMHPWREFGAMASRADTAPLFSGRFGELYAEYGSIDPFISPETARYVNYIECFFANLCRNVPGDFLCAGISFGVGAKMIFEYTNFAHLDKTLHLVDPFDGSLSRVDRRASQTYNNDADYVTRQFPPHARVIIHRTTIPMNPPNKMAFISSRTSDPSSEEKSIPIFYDALSPGGVLISCHYCEPPELRQRGIMPMWLPSGYALFVKEAA